MHPLLKHDSAVSVTPSPVGVVSTVHAPDALAALGATMTLMHATTQSTVSRLVIELPPSQLRS